MVLDFNEANKFRIAKKYYCDALKYIAWIIISLSNIIKNIDM